jgi:hypothetical protein
MAEFWNPTPAGSSRAQPASPLTSPLPLPGLLGLSPDMADVHDPPSLRPAPAALLAAASRPGSRSATKTRCSMCQSCG